jgi:hypothetical protein
MKEVAEFCILLLSQELGHDYLKSVPDQGSTKTCWKHVVIYMQIKDSPSFKTTNQKKLIGKCADPIF